MQQQQNPNQCTICKKVFKQISRHTKCNQMNTIITAPKIQPEIIINLCDAQSETISMESELEFECDYKCQSECNNDFQLDSDSDSDSDDNDYIQDLTIAIINNVIQNQQQPKCFDCDREYSCQCQQQITTEKKCEKKQEINELKSDYKMTSEIPNNVVDMWFDQSDRSCHFLDNNAQEYLVHSDKIFVSIPEIDQEKNDIPVVRYNGKMIKKSIKHYYPNNSQANTCYSHAMKNKLESKIIHDNNIQFTSAKWAKVYFDIETYNENDQNAIPQYDNSESHISMICFVIVANNKILQYCFVVDKHYIYQKMTTEITISKFESEQSMCREFILLMKSLGLVQLCGFNSSSNQYSSIEKVGYDLPWIVAKCGLKLDVIYKGIKSKFSEKFGKKIIRIRELPGLMINDFSLDLQQLMTPDEKAGMQDQKLDSYLSIMKIQNKDDHDYQDLQYRLSKSFSEIGDIINYCLRDCTALFDLDKKKGIIDIKIANAELYNVPIYYACQFTNGQLWTHQQQQLYINIGCLVQYYNNQEGSQFKGAYTENQAISNQVYQNVLPLDFRGLYPSTIIGKNIDILTLTNQEYGYHYIDVSDDSTALESIYYFKKELGIFGQMLLDRRRLREHYKKMMKDDPENYDYWNAKQSAVKLSQNTAYGQSGYRQGLLFYLPIAQCVTAFSRYCTISMKMFIIDKYHFSFLFADTDSLFFQIPNEITNGQQLKTLIRDINLECELKLSVYHELECEEVFSKISFIDGRKSYSALKSSIEDYGNENAKQKLILKGVSWSLLPIYQREQFKIQMKEYLTVGIDNITFFNIQKENLLNKLTSIIANKNKEQLRHYSKIEKLYGKSKTCIALQQYQINEYQIHIIQLLGHKALNNAMKIIPLDFLLERQWSIIDMEQLMNQNLSMLIKFLIPNSQKKISKFKELMTAQIPELENDQCLVRIEKLTTNGKIASSTIVVDYRHLNNYISQYPKLSCHEIITRDIIRLSFDIDQNCDIGFVQDQMTIYLSQYSNQQVILRTLKSDGDKNYYHIFTNLSCTLQFARYIGSQLNLIFESKLSIKNLIDCPIYTQLKSLRLPNSIKMMREPAQIVQRRYFLADRQSQEYFMTNTYNCNFISQPLHTITTLPIDEEYRGFKNDYYSDIHRKRIAEYFQSLGIKIEQTRCENRIDVQPNSNYLCPIHNTFHQRERMFGICTAKQIRLSCYRSTKENYKKESIIIKLKLDNEDQKDQQKEDSNLKKIINQSISYNHLENAILQNNQYLDMSAIRDQEITYIKSSLGTGKTQYLMQEVKKCSRGLILSSRRTFTSNMMQKYNCQSYNTVSGTIDLQDHQLMIVQLESLQRIHGIPDLLIIDELESLFTQLQGSLCDKNNSHRKFINLLQQANRVIVCDGFLQQQSINILNHLSGNRPNQVIENLYQPYLNNTIHLQEFSSSNRVRSRICAQLHELLQEKKKVVLMITSNNLATIIAEEFNRWNYTVKCYTGDDSKKENGITHYQQKVEDLSDVNTNWTQIDLLIYSSTITSGVDYNRLSNFNCFIHCYNSQTCDAFSFVQGNVRVRNFIEKEHYIYFQEEHNPLPKSAFELQDKDYHKSYISDSSEQLRITLQSRKQAIEYYRTSIVVHQLQKLGYTIDHISDVLPKVPKIERTRVFANITDQHIKIFNILKHNKEYLITNSDQIDDQYYHAEKQIAIMISCGIPQSKWQSITEDQFYNEYSKFTDQYHYNQQSKKIGNTLLEMIKKKTNDVNTQNIQHIQDRDINKNTISDILQTKSRSEQLMKFLGDKICFTKEDLEQSALYNMSDRHWQGQLKKDCNSAGYILEKHQKKTKKEIKYTFTIQKMQ